MVPTTDADLDKICILVGPPVMYKAVRLFLEALKTEPTSIPFSKYLVLCGGDLADILVDPPQYSTAPRFLWDLSPLPPEGYDLRFDAEPAASIANARDVSRNWTQVNKERRQ